MQKPSKRWILAIGLGAVIVAVLSAVIIVLVLTGDDSERDDGPNSGFNLTLTPPSDSILGLYPTAAVSCDAEICAEIATDLLANGGSVADAAIGGLLCMGVVHPHSLGIGGGFLLVLYNATTRGTKVLNAREVAPLAATADMFEDTPGDSTVGGRAVAVPGEIKGYWDLHQAHGRLPWSEVLQPTIDLCRNAIPVTSSLAAALAGSRAYILEEESLSEIFVNPDTGDVYVEGDHVTRHRLANTLDTLADHGGDYLYQDTPLANDFIADVQSFGGIMTLNDLLAYRVDWAMPIELSIFPTFELKTVPPPGSGVLLGFMLRVLGNHLPWPRSMSEYALVYQRIIETFKYTYAQRSTLGDPADPEVTQAVDEVLALLKSAEFASEIRSLLLDSSTNQNPEDYGATFDSLPDDHGTAHLSVIGPNGDAIAVTSTINLHFGAKRRSRSTGIILNNEMDDFSSNHTNSFGLPPSPNNHIRPGKRPMSSMCPAIFVDAQGRARLVVGAAGGTKITTATALVALRNLWFGMNVKEALDESRIHHQLYPMEVSSEEGFELEILEHLGQYGHNLTTHAIGGSIVGAVERLGDGSLQANYDYRKSGSVAGF